MKIITKLPFNGNTNDVVGGNNGSPANLTYRDGKSNQAGNFNGSNSYVLYSASLGLGDSFTYEFIFTTNSFSSEQRCEYNSSADSVYCGQRLKTDGKMYLQVYTFSGEFQIPSTTVIVPGKYYTGTFIYNSNGTCKIAINGIIENSVDVGLKRNVTDVFRGVIGNNRLLTNAPWNGKIDEFTIYDGEPTPAEIKNKHLFYNGFF